MSVHYKFKSTLEYDTVTFDGLHISVRDLKKAILYQKRIGKNTDFDLQVTNAQTKEVYTDDNALIPKNTSLIVARIPLTAQQKKAWDRSEASQQLAGAPKNIEVLDGSESGVLRLAKAVDLTSLDASEEDKIQAMMTQSTQDYNPSNYIKIRGANQMGEVPPTYRCYKCHQTGHWIKNCPLSANQDPVDYKKSTGIPRSFMVVVDGPSVPGAMMTPTGEFAVPAIDHQAYKEGKKEKPPFQPEPEQVVEKPEIPEDLLCTVCKDLLTDAIMIPCCGNSFCDDCIRTVLLESEDHECPDCKEKDVSPDSLIPNRFLRNAVNNFKNETGYHRTTPKMQMPAPVPEAPLAAPVSALVSVMATVSVSGSTVQTSVSPAQPPPALAPLLAALDQGSGMVAAPATFEPLVVTEAAIPQKPIEPVNTIPVLGNMSTVVQHRHPVSVPAVVVTAAPVKVQPKEVPQPTAVMPVTPAVVVHDARSSLENSATRVAAEGSRSASVSAMASTVTLCAADTKEAGPAKLTMPARTESQVSHIVSLTSHVTVPTTLSAQIIKQPAKVPVSGSGTSSVQAAPVIPQTQVLIKPPPLRVAEHTHLPPQPIYPSHAARLSAEDRPGTPTIDERNLEGGSSNIVTSLPDTSVPPPNFNPPPPGDTSQHYQIETLEPLRPQRGMGMSFRQDHSYGHRGTRLGGQTSDFIPGPLGPLPLRPPVAPDHSRGVVPRTAVPPQPAPVAGNYTPHGQYDHNRSSYHHDSGSGGRSNYSDMDRDGHMMHRGGFRGYRNRGRAMHGGFRGHGHHGHHHPPSNLNRAVHNGSQSTTIDDPLEAFERMLREKDRKRKLRHPRRSRSFSRSRSNSRSSRSYSRSRTPSRSRSRSHSRSRTRSRTPRSRTRTPRKRSRTRTKSRSRSPSGSFSISSKSRSRSFSRSPTMRGGAHGSPRDRERDRKRDRERDMSPRRRASPHYRSPVPARPSPPSSRYHSSYKDVRAEFDNSSYYEPEFQQYPSGPTSRGGRGGRYRKDYNKDYYDQSYNRYNNDRYSNREPRAVDAVIPVPPGAAQYDANPAYRRYNQYDVAPPGTGPDIPGIGSYEKAHYDRGYERTSTHENRPGSAEYLTPPGVDMRSDYAGRECDVAMQSFREKGVPPTRDRDSVVTSVLRDTRDVSSVGRDNWDRGREMDHIASRDRDVDRERNKDYYEADYRHTYESKSYTYNSPDRKRRHSASPSRRGGSRDHYSNSEQHRHGRSDGRRKGSQRDGGKENRHTLQQPVEALDVTGDRDRNLDKDKESQKRERVLVEVRKEPSVDKEKGKKEKDEKVRKDDDDKSKDKKVKDKKKKKKEKDVDGEKIKKKKRKERKDGKKDSADGKVSTNEKARNEGQIQGKVAKKDVQSAAKPPATTDPVAPKAAQPISVVIGEKKTKAPIIQHPESVVDALYGDMEDTRIDDALVASYGKVDVVAEGDAVKIEKSESVNNAQAVIEIKDESTEIVQTEEQKVESLDSAKLNVVLAPLPEPSKWELDDELGDEKVVEEHLGGGENGIDKSGNKVVTSEVLKRAENAIFQKAINAIRPIEPSKKPAVGERKVYAATEKEKKIPVEPTVIDTIDITRKTTEKEAREARKTANSIQITIPIAGHVERSVELSTLESAAARKEKPKLDRSKFGTGPSILTANQWGEVPDGTSPHRVPVKERLGAKVDTDMDKRREESEREEKSRRQRHRSRSNSREHKQHGSRKGLNLKSAIERKRTVSRSRSRSPYHRKIIADRKYLEPLKYVDPLVAAMELRYMEPADRRYLDPSLERKYMEHGLRRDPRYPEGDRRLIERDIRRPEKHYESERRRDRSPSDSHEREWARTKTREGREHSRHKVKKRTKNRSESHSRKKSTSDRETKRSKKKEKKHKKEKVKKHKAKADKEEKKELENVKVDEKNEPTAEGKLDPENQVSETAKEKPKQITTLETEETGESKEKSKKGSRKNPRLASDRKKSTLDEASFEPDYDLSSSGESEVEDVPADGDKKQEDIEKKAETQSDDKALSPKKRDRSASAEVSAASALADKKRHKLEKDGEKSGEPDTKKSSKVAGGKVSKKRDKLSSSDDDSSDDSSDESDSSSGSSSSSDDDSSDGSSIRRRKKKRSSRRHRRKKGKRSRRAETSSDSDSDSDSDDASSSDTGGARRRGRSTKKHKHHSKRSSKKKKKAKHR